MANSNDALPAKTKGFPNRARIEQYLRTRGLAGRIDKKFAEGVAHALKESEYYADGVEGAQSYVDEMLALDPKTARMLPVDSPVRAVSVKAFGFLNGKIDAALSGQGDV